MATVKVTLEGEFTWEGLQRLQAQLDSLKGRLRAESEDHEVPSVDSVEDTKLDIDEQEALKVQIAFVRNVFEKGGNAWRFVEAAYRLSLNNGDFTLHELAHHLGVTHGAVLAYNRNLGRTAKKWTRLLDVLKQRVVGRYCLQPVVAAAVRVFLNEQKRKTP